MLTCVPVFLSLQAAGELQPAVASGAGLPCGEPPGLSIGHLQVSINGTAANTLVGLAGLHRTASGKTDIQI